jgi:AcrR family transcriptional regulator
VERREQILEVAQDAFMQAGYRGTTALEISRRAGVSEKLVLKHFGSKEGLFRAAVVDPLLALMTAANEDARVRMAAAEGDSPGEAFERVHRFLSMWAALVRQQAPLIVAFIAEMREFPEVARQLGELFRRQVDESAEILALAVDDGSFRPFDPRVAFLAALGAATVAALASDDAEAFLDEYLRLTLFGVLSESGRAAALAGAMQDAQGKPPEARSGRRAATAAQGGAREAAR